MSHIHEHITAYSSIVTHVKVGILRPGKDRDGFIERIKRIKRDAERRQRHSILPPKRQAVQLRAGMFVLLPRSL